MVILPTDSSAFAASPSANPATRVCFAIGGQRLICYPGGGRVRVSADNCLLTRPATSSSSPKERTILGVPVLRTIFAIAIAFSVALAPVALARATMQMRADMQVAESPDLAADSEMADCHGTMKPPAAKDCPCCDTHPKAPCSDKADCLLKCGTLMLGVLLVSAESPPVSPGHSCPADPQKPPDWTCGPPAPPPRA